MTNKVQIYQIFTRLFGNAPIKNVINGTLAQNGSAKMNHINDKALASIKALGITHVWYTGLIDHATATGFENIPADPACIVKGIAGSPYAIRDYYDIAPELAEDVASRMAEFEALVTRTHNHGLKVVIDFVPNHVARTYHSKCKPSDIDSLGENDVTDWAFSPLNNFYYIPGEPLHLPVAGNYTEMPAKVTGNDCFSARPGINDWFETIKLNYGYDYVHGTGQYDPIPDTWLKMTNILLFWAGKGVDAFRCDMAEMVPDAFWQYAITVVRAEYPDMVFIAEIYQPNNYRKYITAGFDYLYDKVGFYDTLRNIVAGYQNASDITWCWQNVDDIRKHMLYFLENHDEQRIASPFFAGNAYKALPAVVTALFFGLNPFMLYFGQELGEPANEAEGFSGTDGRTTIFDFWSVDSVSKWANNGQWDGELLSDEQKSIRTFYQNILNLSLNSSASHSGAFYDLMWANQHTAGFNQNHVYAFARYSHNQIMLICCNFSSVGAEFGLNIPVDLKLKFTKAENKLLTGKITNGFETQSVSGNLDHLLNNRFELSKYESKLLIIDL